MDRLDSWPACLALFVLALGLVERMIAVPPKRSASPRRPNTPTYIVPSWFLLLTALLLLLGTLMYSQDVPQLSRSAFRELSNHAAEYRADSQTPADIELSPEAAALVAFCTAELAFPSDTNSLPAFRRQVDAVAEQIPRIDQLDHTQVRRRIGCLSVLAGGFPPTLASDDLDHPTHLANSLAAQFFEQYVSLAKSTKDLIYYHHISKTGGSTVCQTAWINGCRAVGDSTSPDEPRESPLTPDNLLATDGGNCWSRSFGDRFVWVPGQHRLSALTRNFSCESRLQFARTYGLNFMANEGYLAEDLDERPCREGILSVLTIRDPYKRAISHISHLLRDGFEATGDARKCRISDPDSELEARGALREFNVTCYSTVQYLVTNDYQTRMIGGQDVYDRPVDGVTNDDLLVAKETLKKYDLLFLPEEPEKDLQTLMWRVGVGLPHFMEIGHANKGAYEINMTESEERWLKSRNQNDAALYILAQHLYRLDVAAFEAAGSHCRGRSSELAPNMTEAQSACDLFNIPLTGVGKHYKTWLEFRRKNKEGFACGCGWAGARSTSQDIPEHVAKRNLLPQYQQCPRKHLMSPMDLSMIK